MDFFIDKNRALSMHELKSYKNNLDVVFDFAAQAEKHLAANPSSFEAIRHAGSAIAKLFEQSFEDNDRVISDMEHVRDLSREVSLADNRYEESLRFYDLPRPEFMDQERISDEKSNFLAFVYTSLQNSKAIRIHGVPINKMVEIVREEKDHNDKAFFDAIRLDPIVISCPTIANKIAFEKATGNKDFDDRLRNCFRSPKNLPPRDTHWKLRYFLMLLDEENMLNLMSVDERYELFVVELGVYHHSGPDAARYLNQFIRRWKKYPETES